MEAAREQGAKRMLPSQSCQSVAGVHTASGRSGQESGSLCSSLDVTSPATDKPSFSLGKTGVNDQATPYQHTRGSQRPCG